MAKKRKKESTPHHEFTRRQLSARQRQRRRQRLIFGSGVIIIVAVVLIVFLGWFNGVYAPLHKTAIKVNDTEFNVQYLADALLTRGMGEGTRDDIMKELPDIVKEIEETELIKLGAEKVGYTVSNEEAIERLEESGMAVNGYTIDLARLDLLINKINEEVYLPQVPEAGPQVNIMAMLLESESMANEIRDEILVSGNFSGPAGEHSLDYYTSLLKGVVNWRPREILEVTFTSSAHLDYAFSDTAPLGLSQPIYDETVKKYLGYWLIKVLEKDEENGSVEAQAVLLGSEEEAREIRARLEDGEDLAAIAEEYSQYDKSRTGGGEMGTVSPGHVTEAFEGFAFGEETEIGVWSEPIRDEEIQTQGGYWLLDILGREDNRQYESDDRDYLASAEMGEWVASLKDDSESVIDESFLTNDDIEWLIEWVLK